MSMQRMELLAPAGGMEQLRAALRFGADAVYGGLSRHSLRAFAGRVVRNISINLLRGASRQKRGGGETVLALCELASCADSAPSPERRAEDAEITACLNRWLDSLPRQHRVAFVRRYWYLDSIADLSRRMGWSKPKTTSLLARLRASLREKLNSEGIEI